MIELLNDNGLVYIAHNPGFVITDCPKNLIRNMLELSERAGFTFINAFSNDWLTQGKFPGEKDVYPYQRIIRAFPEEKVIIDPFMGSGAVGIAAVCENRDFIGLEIDRERYRYAKHRVQDAAAGAYSSNV